MAGERGGENVRTGIASGVVISDHAVPFVRVQMEAEGRRSEVARHEAFKLEGSEHSVEIGVNADTILLPERIVEGAFGELLANPLCDLVMDHAPGDHVETSLRGNLLRVGDTVTVFGELSFQLESEGGYRDAASERIHSVRASVIAMGDEAEAQIEAWQASQRSEAAKQQEREAAQAAKKAVKTAVKGKKDPLATAPPPLTQVWVYLGGTIAAIVAAAVQGPFVWRQSYLATSLWLAAVVLVGATAFAWRSRRWMPEFHIVDQDGSGDGIRWIVGGYLALHLLAASILIFAIAPFTTIAFFLVGAVGLFLPIIIVKRDQANANKALALLRAKPLAPELPDKCFGRIEGQFAGHLNYKRTHSVQTQEHWENRTDAQGKHQVETVRSSSEHWTEHARSSGNYSLERPGAASISLRLGDAEWASPAYLVSYPKHVDSRVAYLFKGEYGKKLRLIHLKRRPILEQSAGSGDSILAAARVRKVEGQAQFQSTGPSSFVLFTVPEGRSAGRELRRQLLGHYLGLLLMLASSAAPIVFVLAAL